MRAVLGLGAVVLALAAWVWMTFFPETHSWRQKLTLVVETPQGQVTGSSVVEVRARFFGPSIGNEVEYDLTGEAVVVEVLPGKYLFALTNSSEELFYAAVKGRFLGKSRGEWLSEMPKQTDAVKLSYDLTPMLVTFGDITKPETVREVVEQYDLSAVFGEGVRLKAVTLEITDEPVTEGRVERVLGWLCGYMRPYKRLSGESGSIGDNRLSNRLGPGSFAIGACE